MSQEHWTCSFCSKTFRRSDVLRRHYERCPLRNGQPIPCKLQTGRKRKACDQCVKHKLACDADFPCETCLSRGYQCSGLGKSNSKHSPMNGSNDTMVDINQKFAFLLRYTCPTTTSIRNVFGNNTLQRVSSEQSTEVNNSVLSPTSSTSTTPYSDSGDYMCWDSDASASTETENEYSSPFEVVHMGNEPLQLHQNEISYSLEDEFTLVGPNTLLALHTAPLEDVGHAMIDELIHYATTLESGEITLMQRSDFGRGCSLLLSGKNHAFICNYFSQWNHHTPIVHRATFSLASTGQPLLLAILLTGALLSSDPKDVFKANSILDLAERYIFDHNDFQSLIHKSDPEIGIDRTKSLGAVQAAFQVAQIQLHDASFQRRYNARNVRFDQLSTASKALGIHRAHYMYDVSPDVSDTFDWQDFSTTEANIRLLCAIYNLEASFSVFYDAPPRLYLRELCLDLPCTVEAYTASDAEECSRIISRERHRTRLKVSDILAVFCHGDDVTVETTIQDLDFLHLWILILGLMQEMWLQPPGHFGFELDGSISRGLQRWKMAWDYQIAIVPSRVQEKFGFFKNASLEFWNLATLMLGKGYTRISYTKAIEENHDGKCGSVPECHNALKRILEV